MKTFRVHVTAGDGTPAALEIRALDEQQARFVARYLCSVLTEILEVELVGDDDQGGTET